MTQFHLAQINIGEAKAEMDTELMVNFVMRLDEINALAESTRGFVWRLQTEEGIPRPSECSTTHCYW